MMGYEEVFDGKIGLRGGQCILSRAVRLKSGIDLMQRFIMIWHKQTQFTQVLLALILQEQLQSYS